MPGLATGLPHYTEQVRIRVLCVRHHFVKNRANNFSNFVLICLS